tara:strand:+ start:938 stop:2143 length:1206 start_codon:yes stop_codon:yes gene_type:complete
MLKVKTKNYLLVLLLLFFSGNRLVSFLFSKYAPILGLVLVIILINKNFKIGKSYFKVIKIIAVFLLFITVTQYFQLGLVSVLGMINILIKFTMGGLIIHYLRDKFIPLFFKVTFHLSLLSLLFYLTISILNIGLPAIELSDKINSYVFYGTATSHIAKNMGMFWEPGAYAGILTLCLALNLNNLTYYWKKQQFKLVIVILTLITTQSTTGYIVGTVILFFVLYQTKKIGIYLFVLPVVIAIGVFVYQSNEFLKTKIEHQFENASEQNVGEFSNTRFGSLLFDWHYIEKHPFTGNGMLTETRYADHQYLFVGATTDVVGSGNSFSHYWASFGIFFILGYFFLLKKAIDPFGKLFVILMLSVVFLNLQGEQWFNFPLYLGLIFINFKESTLSSNQNGIQIKKS